MDKDDKQAVQDEKSAEQRFVAEKQAAAKKAFEEQMAGKKEAAKSAAKQKRPVAEIITAWAVDLTPRNAPPAAEKGPLAWVRGTKVPELLALLKDEGY